MRCLEKVKLSFVLFLLGISVYSVSYADSKNQSVKGKGNVQVQENHGQININNVFQNGIIRLPPVPNKLPASSSYFLDRGELKILNEKFNKKGLAVVAITGQVGCGKSQLAAEYAHKNQSYKLIRWLKADTEENLKNSYFSLGDAIGIERKNYADSEALKNAINSRLLEYKKVLLIYDNIEHLTDFELYKPTVGGKSTIHIILTTRDSSIEYPMVTVKEFEDNEIQAYLSKKLKVEVPLKSASNLRAELSNLPLVIVQAGTYMSVHNKTLESYISLINSENRQKIMETGIHGLMPLNVVLKITLDKLSPLALEVIRFCAYLDPDNIPRVLLEQFIGKNNKEEILYELRKQALFVDVGEEGEFFRMHRLFQEDIRRQTTQRYDENMIKTLVERGIEALKTVIGNTEDKSDAELYLFWKERSLIATQIKKLIIEGEKLKINNELLATLFRWAGEYQQQITFNYAESLRLYHRCLAIRKEIMGMKNHSDVIVSLQNIGEVHNAMGQYNKALEYFQESLSVAKITYGDYKSYVATSLNSIGNVFYAQYEYKEALKYFQKSLAIRKVIYGDNHPNVAIILNNIGSVYNVGVKFQEALKYFQHCLSILKESFGDNHPNVAIVLNNIGGVYERQHQYEKALEYFQKSLNISKVIYGNSHEDIAISLNNIGSIYSAKGQYRKALEYFKESLMIRETIYGVNHPDVAISLNSIGDIYKLTNQYKEALEYFQRSLVITRTAYGDNHPNTVRVLKNIETIYNELK